MLGVGLVVGSPDRIVPGQLQQRAVARILGAGELAPDGPAQVIDPMEVRARVPRRFTGLVMPLKQPLGVREGTVLLGVGGGREEEHLGLNVLGSSLTRFVLG